MTSSFGPQPGDTLRLLTTLAQVGVTLVPTTIQQVIPGDKEDYPYRGILHWDYQRRQTTHIGIAAVDLDATGRDPDGITTNYLPAPTQAAAEPAKSESTVIGGYTVPTEPTDVLGCDSCQ